MHKKGIIVCSVFSVLVLGALYSGASFAAQTCTTDEQTGQVTCTNSATASVTVAAACSFSRTSGSGEYSGILANNASVEVTGSTFSTTCNDSGGYAIYAIGYGNNTFGNTDLIFDNDPDNANKITTSSNPGSNTSYWQMKLTAGAENQPVLENGYGGYSAVPSTYTKVASYASADMGTAQTVTATYKAAASATQPAGAYTGAVKYTMVHPNTNIPDQPYNCTANKICYYPNAGNTVADTMGDQSIGSSATTATLLASNFQRTGYGFAGWSDAYDYVVNEGSESNPDASIYGPNEDITFEAGQYGGTNDGLSLYAVWVPVATDTQGNELTFQTTNLLTTTLADNSTLNSKSNGYVTALRDKRDGQVYAVAKLADGNYWMVENLRLEAEYTRGSYYQSLAQGYGGTPGTYGSFVGLASAESNYFANNTTSNTIYKSDDSKDVYNSNAGTLEDIGTSNYPGYRMPRYEHRNTASPASSPTGGNANIYSYGNYYTWAAAIADTTYYGSTNGHTTVATSICPKGWHLPYGNSGSTSPNLGNTSGGFYYLGVQLGATSNNGTSSKKWRSFPNNFLYSGDADSSNINDRGSNGYYWSSSAFTASNAYNLGLGSSGLRPGTDFNNKFYGFTVRCVVAPSP